MAVVGGGLAGIAAAEAACRQGFQVDLFEWTRVLGGRAASLYEPFSEQWIDSGQHLALSCCSEFLALNSRLGLNDYFVQSKTIPFAQTGGRSWTLSANSMLPSSWQYAPAFLRIPFLSFAERIKVGLALQKLGKLAKQKKSEFENRCFADWLISERISTQSIDVFWAPLIYSALSETVDRVSFQAVLKIVQEALLKGNKAMTVHLPTIPLRSIYHDATAQKLHQLGINLHFLSRIVKIHWSYNSDETNENLAIEDDKPQVQAIELADGSRYEFDYFVIALPVYRTRDLLDASELESYSEQLGLDRYEPGAITTVHLWLDRPLLPEKTSYSALLGGPGQFLTCHRNFSKQPDSKNRGFYHTVVISAAHRLLNDSEMTSKGNESLVHQILDQLSSTFVNGSGGKSGMEKNRLIPIHWRVTTFFDAVFSPSPSVYSARPGQVTPFSNMTLAGDWTQTGWPATLEGAVRSGLQAVSVLSGATSGSD